jgi:hypothetical protein
MNESLVTLFRVVEMAHIDIFFTVVPTIALRDFQCFPQALHSPGTVSAVPLVVPMSKTMLLLLILDYTQDWNGKGQYM